MATGERAADDASMPVAGDMVGPYRIDSILGRGGFSTVYAATAGTGEELVALKVIRPGALRSLDIALFRTRFFEVLAAVRDVSHPGVAAVLDFGEDRERFFVALPLMEGRSLDHVIREDGPLGAAELVNALQPIAQGLQLAHERGLIHGDLKTRAIFVTPGGACLLGLGVDQAIACNATKAAVTGTFGYMSPEQAQGAAVDARTDIFSLGIAVYEALTGSKPFTGASPVAFVMQVVQSDPAPRLSEARNDTAAAVPHFSEELEAAVARALAKKPDDRFATVREFHEALQRAVAPATPAG